MKKRLDIQSLLEDTQKKDLVRFLRSSFAKDPSLADDFLIHFASTFELEETEFHLITDRIARMMPGNMSALKHRQANLIRGHLNDLLEQARDCYSREDFRQAFVIISHVVMLLDKWLGSIPEKFGFQTIMNHSYQVLDQIHLDSPAPDLKTAMMSFFETLIRENHAIPFDDYYNPYQMLLKWADDPLPVARNLASALKEKSSLFPEYSDLWIIQQTRVLANYNIQDDLIALIRDSGENLVLYQTLHRILEGEVPGKLLINCLKRQYDKLQKPEIKSLIYHILKQPGNGLDWKPELAAREYFGSGDISILNDLLNIDEVSEQELIDYLENFVKDHPQSERFYLYTALKTLDQSALLKDHLMEEKNIFEIMPFLSIVYPKYREDIETKLAGMVETYLQSHFGRPAVNYVNDILDEIGRMGHYKLIDYLNERIRERFGYRKHFQKLMKEVVQ